MSLVQKIDYVMKALGCDKLVVTNACGSMNRNFKPGDKRTRPQFMSLVKSFLAEVRSYANV